MKMMRGQKNDVGQTRDATAEKKVASLADVHPTFNDRSLGARGSDYNSMSSTAGAGHRDEIKHGVFTIDGVAGPPKRYVLVPQGRDLNSRDWAKILKAWELESPNLAIQLKGTATHPGEIVTSELASKGGLKELIDKLEVMEKDDGIGRTMSDQFLNQSDVTASMQRKDHLQEANKVLHNKLTTFVGALASAADQTNSWLVCAGRPGMAELLLEQALAESKVSPVVLTADFIDKYCLYDFFAGTATFLSRWQEDLSTSAVSLGSERKPTPVNLSGDLWDPEFNTANEHFLQMSKEYPADPFHWKFTDMSTEVAKDFPYVVGPYRGATHYIFFKGFPPGKEIAEGKQTLGLNVSSMASRIEESLHMNSVAPHGVVYMSGGPNNFGHVLQSMRRGTPFVVVHNMGGASHQYALMLETLRTSEKDDQEIGNSIFQRVRSTYPAKLFVDTPAICQVLDSWRANPGLFRDTFAIVNPLQDSADEMLQIISRCFASQAHIGAIELGAGSAQKEVVLAAWTRHAQLLSNGRMKRTTADRLTWLSLILAFFSTAVAIVLIFLDTGAGAPWKKKFHDKLLGAMNVLCIILPALAGLAAAAMTQLQLNSKSAALEIAAAKVVNMIYEFRTRTGRYNELKLVQSKESGGGGIADDSASRASHFLRMQFSHDIQGVVASVMTEVKTDHLEEGLKETFSQDSESLRKHVQKNVLRGAQILSPTPEKQGYIPLLTSAQQGADVDDYVSAISTEAYVSFRVDPILRLFSAQAPRLSRQLKAFQLLLIILATTGTLLAAFELRVWIPVSIALSNSLHALMQYKGLSSHLEATNQGIMNLQNLLIYWSGMGVMERRMNAVREKVVRILESACFAEIASTLNTTGVLMPSMDYEGGEQKPQAPEKKKKQTAKSD